MFKGKSKKSAKTNRTREEDYYERSFTKSVKETGLRAYLNNVVKGNSEVYYVPTFAKGIDMKDLMGRWMKNLKSINDEWPSLYSFENDLANKVGPMSIMLPLEDRMKDIDHYYEGILLPSEAIERSAVLAVQREFGRLRGLTVRNQRNTYLAMRKSTNSGSPFFTKKRLVAAQTIPCTVSSEPFRGITVTAQELATTPFGKFVGAPAVIGWRGQEGGPSDEDVKQRVVWMFPFSVNLRELQVYQPLIEAVQKFKIVPAWVSMDEVDKHITLMFDTKSDNDLVICTDFSKFDQHFNSKLSDVSYQVIKHLLTQTDESQVWLRDVFPIKYSIPLVYNVGAVRFGQHGMGSGSGGTNADETIAHRALQYEAAIKSGVRLNPYSQCLGDDGVLTYPGITVDKVVTAYSSHGLEMNPDKQYASKDDCVYLRRWHHKNYRRDGICVGVYSTCRALGRLRYIERKLDDVTGSDNAIVLRELSILENCKYHPMREQFVQFCMKWDKLRLGLNVPGFFDNIQVITKELTDVMPDFLGYTKSMQDSDPSTGIKDWWIVNYLLSIR